MRINFHKVSWRNFLSTGDYWNTIELDSHATTFIAGANGSGKSTLLDALIYGLYGETFRNVNIGQLVNSVNRKNCLVHVDFSIGSRIYSVRRGMKPKVFQIWIDGTMMPEMASHRDQQDYLEKNILRLTRKTLTRIVAVGSADYKPFMTLPALDRRQITEDVLDINVFSIMNTLLKGKQSGNKEDVIKLESDVRTLTTKVGMLEKHLAELQVNNDGLLREIDDKLAAIRTDHSTFEDGIRSITEKIENINQTNSHSLINTRVRLGELQRIVSQIDRKKEECEHREKEIRNLTNCPTCLQTVTENQQDKILGNQREVIDRAAQKREKMAGEIQKLIDLIGIAEKTEIEIDGLKKERSRLVGNRDTKLSEIRTLEWQRESITSRQQQIDTSELDRVRGALSVSESRLNHAVKEKEVLSVAASFLKDDGIKSMIIRQYVPLINKLINEYLAKMDFYCLFEIDDNFKETIQSAFRHDFTYNSFSMGERKRIDVAILFTWREIAKMRHAASANILILDEIIDENLDEAGMEDCLKIVMKVADTDNVVIISPKDVSAKRKMSRALLFEKKSNFSHMTEVVN